MNTRQALFDGVVQRAVAADTTVSELCAAAGVSRPTYWRAYHGKQQRVDSFIPTLRKLEAALDRIEKQEGVVSGWVWSDDWAPDGLRPMDDLCLAHVRNRLGDQYGPMLAGMIDAGAFHGKAFHYSCDIVAYQIVPTRETSCE